jgi:transcriptional regulator with XRE-family HTH domain
MSTQEYGRIIGKNLRRLASDAGKTQSDISRDLRINKATVSSWMNGTRVPRMDKVDLLAHYFNVHRSDIMGDDVEKNQHAEYYTNPETAKVAQQIFDDPDLHALFDAARDSKPEDLLMAADLLRRLKGTNPDG